MASYLDNFLDKSIQTLHTLPMDRVVEAIEIILTSYKASGTWFLAGNGGSAADAQHIAAEMVGRLVSDRRALPAVSLSDNVSSLTAISNDYGYESVFSRQLEALASPNDVFLAISTSGNSPNIINALSTATSLGIQTISLTGHEGGKAAALSDCAIIIPQTETALIQQAHITVGHMLCMGIEKALFGHHQ